MLPQPCGVGALCQHLSLTVLDAQITSPLLLVHGDADNNPGTRPMQSEFFFQALSALGKASLSPFQLSFPLRADPCVRCCAAGRVCRFVRLPKESHHAVAFESQVRTP